MSLDFGGAQGHPGIVMSQYGLTTTIQRPQATVFGKEAYPGLADKAAVFLRAILQYIPFRGGNRRLALASLLAFFELNGRSASAAGTEEKALENLIKRVATHAEQGIPAEQVFREAREILSRTFDKPAK